MGSANLATEFLFKLSIERALSYGKPSTCGGFLLIVTMLQLYFMKKFCNGRFALDFSISMLKEIIVLV